MTEEDIGIVVVDDDEGFLDETKRALDGKVPTVRFLTDVQRRIDDGSTSVVVLGPSFASEPAMESAAILGEDNEDLGIILVAADIAPTVLRAAMRAGVRDVIEPPLTEQRLNDAVAPLRRRRPAVELAMSPREGKVVTVMSPKGGSGKTVVASNLAVMLAQQLGDGRVALVDADLQFGDDSLVLQLEPRLTVVNIVHDIDRLDEALVDSVLARHPSGLRVLPAPLEPAYADEISLASMIDIIGVMRSMFEVVVVDTSSSFDELLLSLLERSDLALIVPAGEPDLGRRWQAMRARLLSEGILPEIQAKSELAREPQRARARIWLRMAAAFASGVALTFAIGTLHSPAGLGSLREAVRINLPIIELLPLSKTATDVRRGGELTILPDSTDGIVLTLAAPGLAPDSGLYELEIRRGRQEVFRSKDLVPGEGGVFVLLLPRNRVEEGTHELLLRDSSGKLVASFRLEVELER